MTVMFADRERVDWNKSDGLLAVVVQHATTGAVLMQAWMNREALAATLTRGRVVFYSRSRAQLWEKGETSGNTLTLVDMKLDCDGDCLLATALPSGPVCHTGTATCFGDQPLARSGDLSFLSQLEAVVDERMKHSPEGSYTAKLVAQGVKRVAQKVGEEGLEVALAGTAETDEQLIGESADLLFHLIVLLRARGLKLDAVSEALRARHQAATQR